MDLSQAALVFATSLMEKTNHGLPYDKVTMAAAVEAIVETTQDTAEVETLIKIGRWESGGFRSDVATCKKKGDQGQAYGLFQVHPWSNQEAIEACSTLPRQAALALARVRESIKVCKRVGRKGGDLLAIYTVGHCVQNSPSGRLRWGDGSTINGLMQSQ
jgi:hypothetical protein